MCCEGQRWGDNHPGSSPKFMSVQRMVHPAQKSDDPVAQLGSLQSQVEFIQVDLPQAQGFCERDLGFSVKGVCPAPLVPGKRDKQLLATAQNTSPEVELYNHESSSLGASHQPRSHPQSFTNRRESQWAGGFLQAKAS